MMRAMTIVCALLVGAYAAAADTLRVPADFPTIQAAIDAAVDGDVVEIADGVYRGEGNRVIRFNGKAVTVRGASGSPEACVIDCEGVSRGVLFIDQEGPDSVLESVTIINGMDDGRLNLPVFGGTGVLCYRASPMIVKCRLIGNGSFAIALFFFSGPAVRDTEVRGTNGDGILVTDASTLRLDRCIISGNHGAGVWSEEQIELTECTVNDNVGPGIDSRGGSVVAADSMFNNNGGFGVGGVKASVLLTRCDVSHNAGGGVVTGGTEIAECTITYNGDAGVRKRSFGALAIRDTLIAHNSAERGGGVIVDGSLEMLDCDVFYNTATAGDGGGVWIDEGVHRFINCRFVGNSAALRGGAIAHDDFLNDSRISGCLFLGNSARDGGAVSSTRGGDLRIDSSTFVANRAETGGGLFIRGFDSRGADELDFDMFGSIAWMNTPESVALDIQGDPVTIGYCNIEGGFPGEGNIDADPMFVDPDGPDDDPMTFEDNDYRLAAGSPCIDAGDNRAVTLAFDLAGEDRFVDDPETEDTGFGEAPIVDIGAFEYQFVCEADWDGNGVVNAADVGSFLSAYFVDLQFGTLVTDFDGNGVVNAADVGAFLSVYFPELNTPACAGG